MTWISVQIECLFTRYWVNYFVLRTHETLFYFILVLIVLLNTWAGCNFNIIVLHKYNGIDTRETNSGEVRSNLELSHKLKGLLPNVSVVSSVKPESTSPLPTIRHE